MYKRILVDTITKLPRSVLLLGPRQVGKSTLLSSFAPEITINLASPSVFRDYATRPEKLEAELMAAEPELRTVFIDEVQRVPELLDVVQVVLDATPRRFRFLLSGSSARKLRRGQANLLPGRIHVYYMHPLLACELGEGFDLDRVLAHGTLPGIYKEKDPALRSADLRAYSNIYLREEISAEAMVRNIGGFGRLLELAAASSGKIVNINALSRDAGVSYQTLRRHVGVLEDTLVTFPVPAWSKSDRARLVSHPKWFFFDLGVRNALLRRPLDRPLDDERGLLLEHLVAYELHRRLGTLWPDGALYHYRTRHGAEVDFVLQLGSTIWGIEVKASRNLSSRATRGLGSLAANVPGISRQIIVFLGERKQRLGEVDAIPLSEFLAGLPR